MNAGAYGGEMKDVLRKVMVMDQSGKVFEIPAEELQMGYRTSIIKQQDILSWVRCSLLKKAISRK